MWRKWYKVIAKKVIRKLFLPFVRTGYRLRWRSDIWSTNRGAVEVGTPDIRPTTEDDIRHNATTQDKRPVGNYHAFLLSFLFSLSDAEKEGETTFRIRSFFAEILLVVVVIVVVYSSTNFSSVQRLQIRLSILHAHATFRTRVLISLASEELILMKQLEGGSRRTKRCPPDARAERVIMSDMLQGANPHQRRRGRGWPEVARLRRRRTHRTRRLALSQR